MRAPLETPESSARHIRFDRPLFIDTHRARGVCIRQRTLLFAELARRVRELHNGGGTEIAVARPSPNRYIAQLGPVALTVTWLRSRFDSVPEGELLAIIWRGNVASRAVPVPEHKTPDPISTATVLWEETVLVAITSEESWRWCPVDAGEVALTSEELAERYVERLRIAYTEALAAA